MIKSKVGCEPLLLILVLGAVGAQGLGGLPTTARIAKQSGYSQQKTVLS